MLTLNLDLSLSLVESAFEVSNELMPEISALVFVSFGDKTSRSLVMKLVVLIVEGVSRFSFSSSSSSPPTPLNSKYHYNLRIWLIEH